MFVVHHNDDDGRCAAAIVHREFTSFEFVDERNYIEYCHGMAMPDFITGNEHVGSVFIVDLALDDVIFELIKCLVKKCPNSNVVHIDHHASTFSYLEKMSKEDKEIMSHITTYYRTDCSGALLTYIYACMYEDERKRCNEIAVEFSEEGGHFAFYYDTPEQRMYRIPMMLRYINDWDIWAHKIRETKSFHLGFDIVENKHPMSPVWDPLFGSDYPLKEYLDAGEYIIKFKDSENKRKMKHAFIFDIRWIENGEEKTVPMACLNSNGDSTIFGEKINEYPVVCLYMYHGEIAKWYYSLYSTKGVDVSKICEYYGGGGHPGAAGFQSEKLIFMGR